MYNLKMSDQTGYSIDLRGKKTPKVARLGKGFLRLVEVNTHHATPGVSFSRVLRGTVNKQGEDGTLYLVDDVKGCVYTVLGWGRVDLSMDTKGYSGGGMNHKAFGTPFERFFVCNPSYEISGVEKLDGQRCNIGAEETPEEGSGGGVELPEVGTGGDDGVSIVSSSTVQNDNNEEGWGRDAGGGHHHLLWYFLFGGGALLIVFLVVGLFKAGVFSGSRRSKSSKKGQKTTKRVKRSQSSRGSSVSASKKTSGFKSNISKAPSATSYFLSSSVMD